MKKTTVVTTAFVLAGAAFAYEPPTVTVDFSKDGGKLRRELHSSGLGGRLTGGVSARLDELEPLNLYAARTHDWALTNPGQRVLDTHFIFPLLHLDTEDPRNYFFGPTDEILKMTIDDLGMKVLYRMGTSIESVNARRNPGYYNSVEPSDWEQYAKALSHIIRHYTRGWANGFRWGEKIPAWELWNEPNDTPGGSWINADGDRDPGRNRARFNKFSVFVLKRLKAEFPELSFGGPALCWCDTDFMRAWLEACRAEGYRPDFVSWHAYATTPAVTLGGIPKMRALCDELGFTKTRLVLDEWHYLPFDGCWSEFNASPRRYARLIDPVNGLKGIESAVYALQVIAGFQYTALDEGYYYGCSPHPGNPWGIRNVDGSFDKTYYALRLFGAVVGDCDRLATVVGRDEENPVQAYGYLSKDGKRRHLVVARGKFGPRTFTIGTKGLDGLKLVQAYQLDKTHDLALVYDAVKRVGIRTETEAVFEDDWSEPVFRAGKDVLLFTRDDTNAAAWHLVFSGNDHDAKH